MSGLVVGQKLWYVPGHRLGTPHEVTVTKVGRKWATLDDRDRRIDVKGLWLDSKGHSSLGRCYLTREDWEAENEGNKVWTALRSKIGGMYAKPKSLTVERIRVAAEALGITV